MKTLIAFILLLTTVKGFSQASDNDIVKSILGKSFYEVNPTLTKLGVWYHYHFQDNKPVSGEDIKPKVYSIANDAGIVKVYILKIDKGQIVDEIIINFRHDDREQVEAIAKMPSPTDYHVGTYSTDLIFKLKK